MKEIFMDGAAAIGWRLCRSVGHESEKVFWEADMRDGPTSQRDMKASGVYLYRGSSGIALYLAELHRVSGDLDARRIAVDAMRYAVAATDRTAVGLFSGASGVMYAAYRVGLLTGSEDLVEAAQRLLQSVSANAESDNAYDVIGGAAGVIPVLLQLQHEAGFPEARATAITLGEVLLRRAIHLPDGWFWGTTMHVVKGLTGLAHGSAGVGLALLELAHATGDSRFYYGSEQAFAYERAQYDESLENWPDVRAAAGASNRAPSETVGLIARIRAGDSLGYVPKTMAAWCHGAPGIGLARLRAYQLFRIAAHEADARRAIAITIRDFAIGPRPSYSLCHGIAGKCETLTLAASVLGEQHLYDVGRDALAEGVERFERKGLAWPSGTYEGAPDPSLMMGDAGIGLECLRFVDSSVPSILLIPGSDARCTPAERHSVDSGESLRAADVDRFLGSTIRLAISLGMPSRFDAVERENFVSDTAPVLTVRRSIDAYLERDAKEDSRGYIEDVLARDDAAIELLTTFLDMSADHLERIAHELTNEVDWHSGLWRMAAGVRLVPAQWDWNTQPRETGTDFSSRPRESEPYEAIVRRGVDVVRWRIGAVTGLILESLRQPKSLPAIIDYVRERVDVADSARLEAAVVDQLRSLHRGAIIVRAWDAKQATTPLDDVRIQAHASGV